MRHVMTFAAFLLLAQFASAASFDCSGTLSPDEKLVCGDQLLSSLDTRLARVHAAELKKEEPGSGLSDTVREMSKDFLADRRSCGTDRQCVLATYLSIIAQLGDVSDLPAGIDAMTIAAGRAKPSGHLPAKMGECVITRIDAVYPRAGDGSPVKPEDFDGGTSLDFTNGGHQVSYKREEAVIASRPGDRVTLCLVSVPHRCPPGVEDGRGYFTTNHRTHKSWAMFDSQHECGM